MGVKELVAGLKCNFRSTPTLDPSNPQCDLNVPSTLTTHGHNYDYPRLPSITLGTLDATPRPLNAGAQVCMVHP